MTVTSDKMLCCRALLAVFVCLTEQLWHKEPAATKSFMLPHCTTSLFLVRQKAEIKSCMYVKKRRLCLVSERCYWDSKLRVPTADFAEVLRDDKAALAWLSALRRVGIVYLKGAPAEQGQVARLAERIGYLRLTFYG